LGHKEVNRWGKTKSASFYPNFFLPWVKRLFLGGIKRSRFRFTPRDDAFLPQDDWSLFTPTLILYYPKVGLFLPQRRRFINFE